MDYTAPVDFVDHTYSVFSGNRGPNDETDGSWERFDRIITTFLQEQHIPGAVVAVCKLGEIIYKQGYGVAGCSRRVHPDSMFRIASISKPITAAIVLRVCEEAKISLDAAVFGKQGILKKYRTCDKRMKKISIRHLAAFSGLGQRQGTWHAYSNLGYLVLGQLVQEITGKSYEHILKDFLGQLDINSIKVGQRCRSEWNEAEVEYFHNKDPAVVESLYPEENLVLPQYGGMAMPSSASYGGLVADSIGLLKFLCSMELAVQAEQSAQLEKLLTESGDVQCPDNAGGSQSIKTMPFFSPEQVRETLARPVYEKGSGDWYGLGWDVQNNGTSWGHTGGMEGSCGTLHHHGSSGLSWVFLLNAWAQDCDLNGVIKSGLMMAAMAEDDNFCICGFENVAGSYSAQTVMSSADHGQSDAVRVMTRNGDQIVLLNCSEAEAVDSVSELKQQGFSVTWLCCMSQQLGLNVESVRQCKKRASTRDNTPKHPSCNFQKYCFIFTKTALCPKDYIVLFNKSAQELEVSLCAFRKKGYYVNFLDSYCNKAELKFTAVFCLDDHTGGLQNTNAPIEYFLSQPPSNSSLSSKNAVLSTSYSFLENCCSVSNSSSSPRLSRSSDRLNASTPPTTEVLLSQRATDYVHSVKSLVESYRILMQTVTEVDDELWVSCILKPRPCGHHIQTEATKCSVQGSPKHNRKDRKRTGFQQTLKGTRTRSTTHGAVLKTGFIDNNTDNIEITTSSSDAFSSPQNSTQKNMPNLQREFPSCRSSSEMFSTSAAKNGKSSTRISGSIKSPKGKSKSRDTVYWVQITPESFLTELHRQIQRGSNLMYAKFYSASGKPYVSALWDTSNLATSASNFTNIHPTKDSKSPGILSSPESISPNVSRYHRTTMSKYGLLPELAEAASKNILLQSLSEYTEEDGSIYYAALWFT
ncbi:beta-lactamase [Plakobranchus ocellatus]|uniref:Beta-lactamase n=1 Tax=Plakobranchus ocellatus TaxID=259542 RepID=A0AAV4BKW0_9GAST|nr:beta-lactamase [Plakobranchus ocellatus]